MIGKRTNEITPEQLEAVEARARVDDDIVRAIMSRVPPSWNLIEKLPNGGGFRRGGIQVLYTALRYDDGRIWVHASACGRIGEKNWYIPDWEEMKRVKHDFIGEDKWAYQVFPSSKDYVNRHPYVLHLYALLDGSPALPDFTLGLGYL